MPEESADLEIIERPLRRALPGIEPVAPLRILGRGFRSLAAETTGGVVIRIGKNSAAAQGYAREARLLPALAPLLPVAIPQPRWHIGSCPAFPFGAIGYPKLPGATPQPSSLPRAQRARLAHDIAAFLAALHRFPIAQSLSLGIPGPDARRTELVVMRDTVVRGLRDALERAEHQLLSAWWDRFLADEQVWHYTPALIHGDLWYENLLVEPSSGALTGVLDWEDAAVGDPAQDLATLHHLGDTFAADMLRQYRKAGLGREASFARRVQRLWELRELDGVAFALQTHDQAELEDAIRKVRGGPILGGAR